MARFDVTDEAIIHASPQAVYTALVDEHDGRSRWWRPHLSAEHRSGGSYDTVGSLVDNTVAVTANGRSSSPPRQWKRATVSSFAWPT